MKSQIKSVTILGGVFFIFFLLLTPLGLFNESIPNTWQTGYYSVTQIDSGDDTGYYIYLRSAFFDGDLDFINENKYAHVEHFNSTGYVFNHWQIGQSVLFFPFFLIGHLIAILLNNFGYSFSIDGYSTPYYMATAIAAQTYVFIGLLLLYKVLTKYFSQTSALITTIGIWLGTPLVYYSFIRQRMAHGTEFFFSFVFITVWLNFRNSKNKFDHALIGLFFGLLCSIRMINVLYLSIYIIDQVVIWLKNYQKDNNLKQISIRIIFFSIFSALALTPQFLVWIQLDGALLDYINKVLIIMARQSSSSNSLTSLGNKVFQVFFGSRWSLALTTPIFFLGIIGLFYLPRSAKDLLPGLIAFLLSNLLLALTVIDSQSYGNRALLPSIGIIAFGVAGAIDRLKSSRTFFDGGMALIIVFIILQYLIMIQYKITVHYNDPGFTLKAIFGVPNLILDNISLLSRSTNFFKIILSEKTELLNKEGFLFLVLFPSAQLICIIITSFFFLRLNKNIRQKVYSIKYFLVFISFSILIFFFYLLEITPTKTEQEIKSRHLYSKSVFAGDKKAKSGNFKEAFAFFYKAAKNLPDHWGSYLRMAYTYDAQSEYEMAIRYYKMVLKINPYSLYSHINIGRNYFYLGRLEEAEIHIKKSFEISPNNKEGLYYLGVLFAEKRLIPEAIKMFELSLAVDPNYKSAHLNFALLLSSLKQYQKAIFHLKEALRLGAEKNKVKSLIQPYGLRLEG